MIKCNHCVFLLVFVIVVIFSFLSFGNPQINKYVYMFQAYVFPKHEGGWIEPELNYKGTWKYWSASGHLKTVEEKYFYSNSLPYQNNTVVRKKLRRMFPELSNEDCQKSKWHYLFKKQILGEKIEGPLLSNRFSGMWRVWDNVDNKIVLLWEAMFLEGRMEGISKTYHINGQIDKVSRHKNGAPYGIELIHDSNGALELMKIWHGKKNNSDFKIIETIYDASKSIDLRPQYTKEIAEFESELAKFEQGLKATKETK